MIIMLNLKVGPDLDHMKNVAVSSDFDSIRFFCERLLDREPESEKILSILDRGRRDTLLEVLKFLEVVEDEDDGVTEEETKAPT